MPTPRTPVTLPTGFGSSEANHGAAGDSFRGGGVGGEHNPKYKTKNPETF